MTTRRTLIKGLSTLPLLGVPWASAHAADPVNVAATFSVLADFVRQVGGNRVNVSAFVGPNGDAHIYSPSAADARKLAAAKLIVINGLGLEHWFDALFKASHATAPITIATLHVTPIPSASAAAKAANGKVAQQAHGHDHGDFDPHAWQNVMNAKIYVQNIRDGLSDADPAGKDEYRANADGYLTKLDNLEQEVRTELAKIPDSRRVIITTHDAFGYFGAAYGMRFIAPQGVSTETEASPKDVAKIISQIKAQKIPAVFLENVSDKRLLERIAKESGAIIGGTLYSDALSEPTGPASTYIDMIRNNVHEFTKALVA